jgi:hypothetical protein
MSAAVIQKRAFVTAMVKIPENTSRKMKPRIKKLHETTCKSIDDECRLPRKDYYGKRCNTR